MVLRARPGSSAGATAATRPFAIATSRTPSISFAGSITRPPRRIRSKSAIISLPRTVDRRAAGSLPGQDRAGRHGARRQQDGEKRMEITKARKSESAKDKIYKETRKAGTG